MKTFKVTRPYWVTYDGTFDAVNEEEALKKFGDCFLDELNEDWQGPLSSYETIIEEVESE